MKDIMPQELRNDSIYEDIFVFLVGIVYYS